MMRIITAAAIVCWITPIQADIVYNVNMVQFGHQPAPRAEAIGTITTDGTLGALQPGNILGWHITVTETNWMFNNTPIRVFETGSDLGNAPTWTSTLAASESTLLWSNVDYLGSLNFGAIDYHPASCGSNVCGERRIGTTTQFYGALTLLGQSSPGFFPIAENVAASVPGPIAGAGLPGFLFGLLAVVWRKRRVAGALK
jgi:hypothetical protein